MKILQIPTVEPLDELPHQRRRRLRLEKALQARQRTKETKAAREANARARAIARQEATQREAKGDMSPVWSRGLFKKYGLRVDEMERLLKQQGGRCAICHVLFGQVGVCVDHNHTSGMVRGLLCSKCNTGLGQFNDDKDLLQLAIAYLQKPPGWAFKYGRRHRHKLVVSGDRKKTLIVHAAVQES